MVKMIKTEVRPPAVWTELEGLIKPILTDFLLTACEKQYSGLMPESFVYLVGNLVERNTKARYEGDGVVATTTGSATMRFQFFVIEDTLYYIILGE